MENINIQERIREAKYYISLGKTEDALRQLLPVLIYLRIPHSIVDRMYVLEMIASITMLDGFKRAKSFFEHMDTESNYQFLNEHGCLEPVRVYYVKELVEAIEDKIATVGVDVG